MKVGGKIAVVAVCGGALLWGGSTAAQAAHIKHPQKTWAKFNRKPLSDRAAAKLVTHVAENRPMNPAYNRYYVTNADLRKFRTTKSGHWHQTAVQKNPWNAYVTGRSFLHRPSTDDLIQWGAHKWGIPADLLRAQLAFESAWEMNNPGDLTVVPQSWYWAYPSWSRLSGWRVWLSAGMAQIKWTPDNETNDGTEPLRWKSTAFNVDYLGATIRYFYDGKCTWCHNGYHRGQQWMSVGAWNRPQPWGNARQHWYVAQVKGHLRSRIWTQYK